MIGPFIVVAVSIAIFAVFPVFPIVYPERVVGIVRFVGVKENANEVATGLMVNVPVLVSIVGLTSNVI